MRLVLILGNWIPHRWPSFYLLLEILVSYEAIFVFIGWEYFYTTLVVVHIYFWGALVRLVCSVVIWHVTFGFGNVNFLTINYIQCLFYFYIKCKNKLNSLIWGFGVLGLTFATVLTMVVLPVIYAIIYNVKTDTNRSATPEESSWTDVCWS